MDLLAAIKNLLGQNQQLVSPVPENDTLNSPSKLYYVDRNTQMSQAAGNQPAPQLNWGFLPGDKTPTGTVPNPELNQLTQKIQKGFMKYGSPQAAKYAPQFAQAGLGLPDPLLPAVLAMKETSAGKKLAHANNWLNIGPNVDYPDVPTNILGGQGHRGFVGIIHGNPAYQKYLKSGNNADFFNVYTPVFDSSGKKVNASIPDQLNQYNDLRSNFE